MAAGGLAGALAWLAVVAVLAVPGEGPSGVEAVVRSLQDLEVLALSPERGRAVVRRSAGSAEVPPDLVLVGIGDSLPGLRDSRVVAVLPDRLEVELVRTGAPEGGTSLRAWLGLAGAPGPAGPVLLDSRPAPAEAQPRPPADSLPGAAAGPVRTRVDSTEAASQPPHGLSRDGLPTRPEEPSAPPGTSATDGDGGSDAGSREASQPPPDA